MMRRFALLCGISVSFGCFISPAKAVTLTVDEVINRTSLNTPTLNYLIDNTLQFSDDNSLNVVYDSAYSLSPTDSPNTNANVFTKSVYNPATQSVDSQNYEIYLDPYFAFSGENSVTTKILNGGTFTTYYDIAGKRAALNPGKVASQYIGTFAGLSTNNFGGVFQNLGTLGLFGGNFINNHAENYGGSVLFNYNGTVSDIEGIFIGNNAQSIIGGTLLSYQGKISNINGYFLGNTTTASGGAITNYQYANIDNITGDFIGNTAKDGGAIYNYRANIGNIVGDFIGNSATGDGGAIYNYYNATINNIVGDFVGNTASAGGAINNAAAQIDNISGNFISNTGNAIYNYHESNIGNISGNFVSNTGNAIYNYYESNIDNISGTFIDNKGAAIYNYYNSHIGNINADFMNHKSTAIHSKGDSTIGKINGKFIDNRSENGLSAIFVDWAVVDEINGTFINNSSKSSPGAIFLGYEITFGGPAFTFASTVKKIEGTFIGNSANSASTSGHMPHGGAIGNDGEIGTISGWFEKNFIYAPSANGGAIGTGGSLDKIINSVFIDNYAQSNNETNTPYGGAIYSADNLYLEANDGFDFRFEGNYIQQFTGPKDYQAIYISRHSNSDNSTYSPNTLTFDAKENAKFTVKDGIQGVDGYGNLVLTSADKSGTINFYNYIQGFDATVDNAIVNLFYADDDIIDYTQRSLAINSGKVNLTLDVNTNGTSDTITMSNASSGLITIDDINFIGNYNNGDTITYKVLNTNDALKLALAKTKYVTEDISNTIEDTVSATVDITSNKQFNQYTQTGSKYNDVALATTSTTNDSLKITYGKVSYDVPVYMGSLGDTLALWNSASDVGNTKVANITLSSYTADDDLGTSFGTSLVVNGKNDGVGTTIDLSQKNGFDIGSGTNLTLKDVTLDNALDYALNNNIGGQVTLDNITNNTTITNDGNITTTKIKNMGTLNGTGTMTITENSVNSGLIESGIINLDSGVTFTNDGVITRNVGFNIANGATLNVVGGTASITGHTESLDYTDTIDGKISISGGLLNLAERGALTNMSIAELEATGGIISTQNNNALDTIVIGKLTADGAKFRIDVHYNATGDNQKSDIIKVTDPTSTGVVTISSLEFLGTDDDTGDIVIKVLDNSMASGVSLALDRTNFVVVEDVLADLTDTIYSNKVYK